MDFGIQFPKYGLKLNFNVLSVITRAIADYGESGDVESGDKKKTWTVGGYGTGVKF